ncbi:hypothetical protein MTP03_25110 [Tsukamurella sp. PLM1]|nr:hypothetical protein MTP03_25110 [Tsukamurella sp. PLM1]
MRVTAAVLAVVLGVGVILMHTGLRPTGLAHGGGGHAVERAAPTVHSTEHRQTVEKQTADAVHQHDAHDCAGTVVVHKSVAAPPLVATLPWSDGAPGARPSDRAAVARGPPPWTVLDLHRLCVLRV